MNMKTKKIVVIGDIMLDKYNKCVNRENPESSAPCYTIIDTEYKPGGAGNVAANLASLGSKTEIISVIGEDENSKILRNSLVSLCIPCYVIVDKKRQTIVKERFISAIDGRYHFRADREKKQYIEENHVSDIIKTIKKSEDCSLILVSDYNKGVISENLMAELKKLNIPIIVDPKPAHKDFYKGVFLLKPNIKEVREMSKLEEEIVASELLRDELQTRILLTKGKDGMSYFGLNGKRIDLESEARKVSDVTGAGDTTVAAFAHFFNKGKSIEESVMLANIAAGIAVAYPGCYQVTEKEIFDFLAKK